MRSIPGWDQYYLEICKVVAARSKDPNTQIGSVIIGPNHEIRSTGYNSFPRRLIRLGHISFFGLGFLNALFALTISVSQGPELPLRLASLGLLTGAVTMPLCCFASAWRKKFRCLFPIPVTSLLGAVSLIVLLLARS